MKSLMQRHSHRCLIPLCIDQKRYDSRCCQKSESRRYKSQAIAVDQGAAGHGSQFCIPSLARAVEDLKRIGHPARRCSDRDCGKHRQSEGDTDLLGRVSLVT